MTDIDLERLKVDREYWDIVTPKGSEYYCPPNDTYYMFCPLTGMKWRQCAPGCYSWEDRDPVYQVPPNSIPRPPKRAQEVERDGDADAYMCPAGCGCLWRDNGDDTMSLYGPRSQSCDVCEPLPLDRMVPVKTLRTPEQRLRDEMEETLKRWHGCKVEVIAGVLLDNGWTKEPKP